MQAEPSDSEPSEPNRSKVRCSSPQSNCVYEHCSYWFVCIRTSTQGNRTSPVRMLNSVERDQNLLWYSKLDQNTDSVLICIRTNRIRMKVHEQCIVLQRICIRTQYHSQEVPTIVRMFRTLVIRTVQPLSDQLFGRTHRTDTNSA